MSLVKSLRKVERQPLLFQVGWLSLIFVLTRGAFILCLWALFGGKEPASDLIFYSDAGSAPVAHLLGKSGIAAYPPLQGFLLWPLVSLSAPAPAFAWLYRIVFASLELALYVLVLLLAKADDRVFSRLLFLTFLPLPLLATVVWVQEEILAAAFIFLGLISWHKERPALAIVIWSFGVVGGKVYILPLLVLGLAYLIRTRMYGPVFLATAIVAVSYAGRLLGGGTGFEGFVPENFFTNTLWSMPIIQEHIELRTQFHVSAALCGVWSAIWLAYWMILRPPVSIGVMYAVISLGIFLLFFHVNPEYFLLPYFALLACFALRMFSWQLLLASGLLLSCAWVHNIAYAVCVSRKMLSCEAWVYPYGSLVVANATAVLATASLIAYVLRSGRHSPFWDHPN